MFSRDNKNKQKVINEKVQNLNQRPEESVLSDSLTVNIELLKQIFVKDDTFIVKSFKNSGNSSLHFAIAFCDGVVDSGLVNEFVIRPLLLAKGVKPGVNLLDDLSNQIVQIKEIEKTKNFSKIIDAVTYGNTVLFTEGSAEALILNTPDFETRSISEPDGEKILSGPREGFTELLLLNLSLVRRKLRTNHLKIEYQILGQKTKTKVCVCYIDGVVNPKILQELKLRLGKIDIDGVLDANYINELIRDARYSPFRTTGYTERPDVVVAKLLEGRIAVFIDGTPVVLTVPYLFVENFQSGEDYYFNFYYATFSRFVRIVGFLLTIGVPGFYVAIVAYHHEMLPTPLLINIAVDRQSVPFPAALEAFVMLFVFDILRETGIRMPSNVGQALSIVGALVIGQSAVDAKLVAAPMIIVVALTGITNLVVPKMNAPIIYIRIMLLMLGTALGLYGFVIGLAVMTIHLLNLRSFGVPHLSALKNLQYQDLKDSVFRAPWWQMRTRPKEIAGDITRLNNNGEGGQ